MAQLNLYLADIRPLAEREEECLALLPPGRRTEAEARRVQENRLHKIAAGLLLRRVLGITREDQVEPDEHGKLHLTGDGPHFNLSHGGNYAVLALFHTPVGVDIEPIRERPPRALPKRWLRPEELAWLEEDLTPERFAWIWTRLESALKADGRGLMLKERDFSLLDSGHPWHFHTLPLEGHVLSCAAGESFEAKVTLLTTKELLNEQEA